MIETAQEVQQFFNSIKYLLDHVNEAGHKDDIRDLLKKIQAYVQHQEQEKQELKSELEKWKPKFEIGQEVYFNGKYQVLKSKIFLYQFEGKTKSYWLDVISDDVQYELNYDLSWTDEDGNIHIYEKDIFATKEEAERSRDNG